MPNGGISLLPEDMREKEKQELEQGVLQKKEKPELYIPERAPEAPEVPEVKPAPAPPKSAEPKKPERILPYKPRPRTGAPPPPVKPPLPPRRGLQVSLIPEETVEKRINTGLRKTMLAVIVVIEVIILAVVWFFVNAQTDARRRQIADFDKSIQDSKSQIEQVRGEQKDLLIFEKKLASMSDLLASHVYTSKMFEFLEKNTVPDVWYESYISTSDAQVSLAVNAKNMQVAAEQIAHLEGLAEIEQINVNSFQTRLTDRGQVANVGFDMQVIFTTDFLLKSE